MSNYIAIQLFPGQFQLSENSTDRLIATIVVSHFNRHPAPKPIDYQGIRTLLVPTSTNNMSELSVSGYAQALDHYATAITQFINEQDPQSQAILISYLPAPHMLSRLRHTYCYQHSDTAQKIEHKSALIPILKACNAAIIPYHEIQPPITIDACNNALNHIATNTAVAQKLGLFSGGNGTYLLEKNKIASSVDLLNSDHPLKVMPDLGRESYGTQLYINPENNGDCSVLIFPIARQIYYITDNNKIIFQGNQLGSFFSDQQKNKIHSQLRKIAHFLYREYKYCGLLGMDFLYTKESDIYIVDLNARAAALMSSLVMFHDSYYPKEQPLLQKIFCQQNQDTLMALDTFFNAHKEHQQFSRRSLNVIAKHNFTTKSKLPMGIYQLDIIDKKITLTFKKHAYAINEISNPEKELLCFPFLMPEYKQGDSVLLSEIYIEPPLEEHLQQTIGEDLNKKLLTAMINLATIEPSMLEIE